VNCDAARSIANGNRGRKPLTALCPATASFREFDFPLVCRKNVKLNVPNDFLSIVTSGFDGGRIAEFLTRGVNSVYLEVPDAARPGMERFEYRWSAPRSRGSSYAASCGACLGRRCLINPRTPTGCFHTPPPPGGQNRVVRLMKTRGLPGRRAQRRKSAITRKRGPNRPARGPGRLGSCYGPPRKNRSARGCCWRAKEAIPKGVRGFVTYLVQRWLRLGGSPSSFCR